MKNKEMTQKRKITRQSGEFAYQKYLELKGGPKNQFTGQAPGI